ncbi:unnamed protein product [Larinioides sclopetarius]|uniref:Secreted protein n=1 Tax=Larinioides sclopetarius TaxID=280406 RepID=A0AAV2AYQ6_9ARAC
MHRMAATAISVSFHLLASSRIDSVRTCRPSRPFVSSRHSCGQPLLRRVCCYLPSAVPQRSGSWICTFRSCNPSFNFSWPPPSPHQRCRIGRRHSAFLLVTSCPCALCLRPATSSSPPGHSHWSPGSFPRVLSSATPRCSNAVMSVHVRKDWVYVVSCFLRRTIQLIARRIIFHVTRRESEYITKLFPRNSSLLSFLLKKFVF